jgi:hypothetical protein
MIQRCYNPHSNAYKDYGAKGRTVCDRWLGEHGFEHFLEDMGECPGKKYSIGRKNNQGDYYPENCGWETDDEQAKNTSRTIFLTYDGRTMCMTDWAREKGWSVSPIRRRKKLGWSDERILTTPLRARYKKR